MLWITLSFYLIAFTDFLSGYIPVSIAKVFIYLLAEVLILFYIYKHQKIINRINLIKYVIVPYLLMLFIRLCLDFVIPGKGFSIYGNSYTIVFFYFNAIIIPLFFYTKFRIDINLVHFCIVAGIIMSICFLLSLDEILFESIEAASKGGQYDASGHLDIISYGHYSCALSLIGVYLLFFHQSRKINLISFVFIAIGLAGISLSAARSAVVALFVGIAYLYISKFGSAKKILLGALLLYLSSSFFTDEIVKFGGYLEENGFYGFSRIVDTFFNGDESIINQTSGRDYLYKIGLTLFLENPIFGYAYLLPTGTYVHNIFIEQFMALGLIGGLLFMMMNFAIIKYTFIIAKHCPIYSIFSVLFIQNLIYGCFSLTIIGLTAYWLFAALVINTYMKYKYEKRIGYNSNI